MEFSLIEKLNKDLKEASKYLSKDEIRALVDMYYSVQDYRKATRNQMRAVEQHTDTRPTSVIESVFDGMSTIEKNIKSALNVYTDNSEIGAWMKDITGIGPVIAAGLIAHIDIEKAPTVGHIWSFAGINPDQKWEKGEKRPWNAKLKTLCWKIGESFVKVSGNEKDVYGKVYVNRKEHEQEKNEKAMFKAQAEHILKTKKIGKTTDAYKHYIEGKLPPAHIHARAKRYAVKLFLSDLHYKWYCLHFGEEPPLPYPIAILGHGHLKRHVA